MHSLLRLAALTTVLVGLTANAQIPRPRVMVILDTSRSMMEYPVFTTCPACPDTAVPVTEAAGGDYNMFTDNACVSKFCMAKKAVNQVLPAYTDDARIGLGTYYQYVLKAESTNTLATSCTYDVFAPADVRKRFTSLTDYTGSGMTVCADPQGALAPDATCTPGSTRTSQLFFPDSSLGGSFGLKNFCPMPAGVTTPANPTVAPTPCGADTRNCYQLTKVAAAAAAPVDCNIYTWPLPALPGSFTNIANNGAGCINNMTYDLEAPATAVLYPPGSPLSGSRIEQIVSLATPSCPAAVARTTTPGAPSLVLNATPVVGSAVGQWRRFGGATERCTPETPCAMFSYSSTPVERLGSTSWYAFHSHPSQSSFTPPGTLPALSGTYQFSQYNAGGAGYTGAVLNGSVMQNNGVACLGGGWPLGTGVGSTTRYTGNQTLNGTFGVPNPQGTLDGSSVSRGTRTDDTPGRVGNNYTCTANTPCDVTLSADVDVPGMWNNNVATIYANAPAGNERTTAIAPDSFVVRLRAPLAACPAGGSISSSAVLPANAVWHSPAAGPMGCTGGGQGACSFTLTASSTVSTMACGNVVRWSNLGASATPPANCAFNNKAYTGPTVSGNIAASITIPASSTCGMGTFDVAAPGTGWSGCGSFPCKVTYVNNTPGAPDPSPWGLNRYNRLSPPAGWSGAPARDETIGTVNGPVTSSSNPSCEGSNNSYVQTNTAALCPAGAPCTVYQLGPAQISPTGCGTENGPCYACRYERRRFQWDRPTTVCNYTANTYTWTVDQTAPSCTYSRARWQLDRRDPDRHRCEYQIGAKRYDFAPPTEKVCEYWTVRSTIRSLRNTYTYEYKTKGTEIIGRATARTTGSNMCGSNGSGSYNGAFAAACPATAPCSTFGTMVSRTNSLGAGSGPAPAGTTCKLHWGGGDDLTEAYRYTPYSTATGVACGGNRCLPGDACVAGPPARCYTQTATTRGRYYYQDNNEQFQNNPLTSNTSGLCEENTQVAPPAPDQYQVLKPGSGTPGFCSNSGVPSSTVYSLVSDYYSPSTSNTLSTYTGAGCTPIAPALGPPPQPGKPCYPTAGSPPPYSSVLWTQVDGPPVFNNAGNNKLQGFAARAGVSAPPSGVVPAVSTLVPIPDDTLYNATSQANALRAATSLCVMPSADVSPADGVQDGPNADGSLRGGACVADFADRTGPGLLYGDYTPLFGSIKNASDYLLDRWNNDPEPNGKDCRDYFIILATDGLENTPANYSLTGSSSTTSVEGLVGSLRNTSTTYPRTRPDIRTFVIGFGEGAAGAGVTALNAVATAGGTTNAFFPSTLADLQNALNAVFTTILTGQYSRSKPALGTNGDRLYAAQYVRPVAGYDWYGLLTAYGVDPNTGAPMTVWEHHTKLNDPGHPARTIKGVVFHDNGSDRHTHVDDFMPGMNFRDSRMDTRWDFNGSLPDGGTPDVDDVIDFLRRGGERYDRLQGGAVVFRSSALAPIVNSSPVVVGKSPFDDSYGGSTGPARSAFHNFVNATKNRGTRIYFASTEGFIHSVIDNVTLPDGGVTAACVSESSIGCPNGREDWSLAMMNMHLPEVPSHGQPTIAESMFKLKSTGSWAMNMLNGPVSVADVCNEQSDYSGAADNCTTSEWRTVLISSMREGGRSLVAIDITDHSVPSGNSNGNNLNGVLWTFEDSNLGLTYSVPAIGRVRVGGNDKFVAVFGGGADDPNQGGTQGDRVYVVDALRTDGDDENHPVLYADLWQYRQGGIPQNFSESIVSRPATYRRPGNPYIDTAYVAAGDTLYATRFGKPDGTQWNNTANWQPDEFFDPTSTRNDKQATNPSVNTIVNRVVQTYAGDPGNPADPPQYALAADGALPLASAPSILNRAKLGNSLVGAGGKPDLYVGTGDISNPDAPAAEYRNENYFYAVHDFNDQTNGSTNDGRALWVAKFCGGAGPPGNCVNKKEQVVSEPAIISSCIIVATYTPTSAATCSVSGDTTLYGFNLITGALTSCLVFPPGSPWAGTATPALRLEGAGIPSDLVVINDNLYFMTSNTPGVNQVTVRQNPRPGAVRSYRRIK